MKKSTRRILSLLLVLTFLFSFSAIGISAESAPTPSTSTKQIVISSGTSTLNNNYIDIVAGTTNYTVDVPLNSKTLSVDSVPASPTDKVTISAGGVEFPLKTTFIAVDNLEIVIKIASKSTTTIFKVTAHLSADREVEYLNNVISGFEQPENGGAVPSFMIDVLKARFEKLSNTDQNRIKSKSIFAFVISSGTSFLNENNVVYRNGVTDYIVKVPLNASKLSVLSIPDLKEKDTVTVTADGVDYALGAAFPIVDNQKFTVRVTSGKNTTTYNFTAQLLKEREVEYLNSAIAEFEKPENGGAVPSSMIDILRNRVLKLPVSEQNQIVRKQLFGIVLSSGSTTYNDNFVALIPGTKDYTVNVPLNAKTLSVDSVPGQAKDKISITANGKTYAVKTAFDAVDQSTIEINVKSGETETTYKLKVNFSAEREVEYLNNLIAGFQSPENGGAVPSFMLDILKPRYLKLKKEFKDKVVAKALFEGTYTPPVITIEPYNTKPTNKDITVTAKASRGTINAKTYTFKDNNFYDFTVVDEIGNITTKRVVVSNIDKTAPEITLTDSKNKVITNNTSVKGTVTVKVTDKNTTTNKLTKDKKQVTWPKDGKIKQTGKYQITVTDSAGNASVISFTIK